MDVVAGVDVIAGVDVVAGMDVIVGMDVMDVISGAGAACCPGRDRGGGVPW
jgi:hypothetical protein